MRASGTWAALLFVMALTIGSALDSVSHRMPPKVGDEWLLAGDFHVHAFPGDGGLAPWSLRREAQHAGVDVFAITNHNQTFAGRLGRWLAGMTDGPIVISGSEITNPRFHLIAAGIETPVDWNQTAEAVIKAVHAQGGVAIAAHPSMNFADGWNDSAIALLDGTEVAHPDRHFVPDAALEFDAFRARTRRLNPGVAPIGSSDFHVNGSLAYCRTYVFVRQRTEAGVLDAIRRGRAVAEDGDGRLYGDPTLVRLVERNHPPHGSDAHPWWRRFAIASAWAVLLGILCLRAVRR